MADTTNIRNMLDRMLMADREQLRTAVMALQVLDELDIHGEADKSAAITLASRVRELMPLADDPRFSMHDYMDGVANARKAVSLVKLAAMPDDLFMAAMTWLAVDKRETYEEKGHTQDPLDIDIYE